MFMDVHFSCWFWDDDQNIPGTLFIHKRLDVYYFLLVLDDEQNIPGTLFIHERLDVYTTSCWFWTMIRIFLEPSTSTKGWMSTSG
jgi:hypothetical protein